MKTSYPAFTVDNAPKAGDKVVRIVVEWGETDYKPVRILTVTKVTPTGIIRTAEGESFRLYNGRYIGITPYTPELAEQADAYQRKQAEAKARRRTIDDARRACCVMADRGNALPYEMAVKILEIYATYKEAQP